MTRPARRAGLLGVVLLGLIAWFVFTTDDPPEHEHADEETTAPDVQLRDADAARATAPTLGGAPALDATKAPRRRLSGRLVDAASGEGIAGAAVQLRHRESRSDRGPAPLIGITGPDGAFSLDGVGEGTWILIPFHKDYYLPFFAGIWRSEMDDDNPWERPSDAWDAAARDGLVVDVRRGAQTLDDVVVRLYRGQAVRGRVLGPDDQPVAGASIRAVVPFDRALKLVGAGLSHQIARSDLSVTDDAGRFTLGCFPPDLKVISLGAAHQELIGQWQDDIALPTTTDLELRLHAPARVGGRAQNSDGSPVAALRVGALAGFSWIVTDGERWAPFAWAQTDDDGRFMFERVPPGDVLLVARPEGGRAGRAQLVIESLAAGETRSDVVLAFDDGRRLSGILVAADGTPLEGELIEARPRALLRAGDWTDEEGAFSIVLEAATPVSLFLTTAGREELLVADLEPPRDDLRLVATATPHHAIRVRVEDPDGKVIPACELEFESLATGATESFELIEGVAEVSVPGQAPFLLKVEDFTNDKGDYLPHAAYSVELPNPLPASVVVRLPHLPEFHGSVLDQHGKPVDGVHLMIRERLSRASAFRHHWSEERRVPISADGRFRFVAERAATRRVRGYLVVPEGCRVDHGVWLSPGEFERFVVHCGGQPVEGRVELVGDGVADLSELEVHVAWLTEPGDAVHDDLSIETLADGRFVIPAVPQGVRMELRLDAHELRRRGLYVTNEPTVIEAGAVDVRLPVRLGQSIAGRLEGPGLATFDFGDARVGLVDAAGQFHLFWYEAVRPTADAPRFRMVGVPPGLHRLVLVNLGGPGRALHVRATLDGVRGGREDVVLHVPVPSGVLEGTVQLPEGVGPKDVKISVFTQDAIRVSHRKVPVDARGRFRLLALHPDMEYSVRAVVSPGRGDPLVAELHAAKTGQAFVLEPVRTTDLALRFVGARPRESDLEVILTRSGIRQAFDVSDMRGVERLSGLLPGTYALRVESERGVLRAGPVTVKVGTKEVVVVQLR